MRNNLFKLLLVIAVFELFGCSPSTNEQEASSASVTRPSDAELARIARAEAEANRQEPKDDQSPKLKVDFALNCIGQKNGNQATFVAYENEAKFTYQTPGYFIQKNLSKVSTDVQKYTYNVDSEWTTFEGPLFLKNIQDKHIELIRDTLELDYFYPDGRDPFSCSKVSDDEAQTYLDRANEMLNIQKNEAAAAQEKADHEAKQREKEQIQRNKI